AAMTIVQIDGDGRLRDIGEVTRECRHAHDVSVDDLETAPRAIGPGKIDRHGVRDLVAVFVHEMAGDIEVHWMRLNEFGRPLPRWRHDWGMVHRRWWWRRRWRWRWRS